MKACKFNVIVSWERFLVTFDIRGRVEKNVVVEYFQKNKSNQKSKAPMDLGVV